MPVVDVLNTRGEKTSQTELADSLFNVAVIKSVLHEVVTMQLAARRAGTASVKHRSDVSGSGRKLFRQKGTGRARRGDIKAPPLRGAGSVFGPDPRSYGYRVPKKVRKMALKMALSSKLQEQQLLVLDELKLERIRTQDFVDVLAALKIRNALIIVEAPDENLELSSRNVPDVKVLKTAGLNVYDILKYENLVLLESSIKGIEGRLLS